MRRVIFVWMLTVVCTFLCGGELKIAVLSDLHVSPGNREEAILVRAIEEINASQADWVVVNGDLTNQGRTAELRNVARLLKRLQKQMLVIPGNHETNWSDNGAMEFQKLWGDDKFAVRCEDVVLLGVSTGPYMKMGNGFIRSEDLRFLREKLGELASHGEKILLFIHYPTCAEFNSIAQLRDIFRTYDLRAVVAGHWHQMFRQTLNGFPNIICRSLSSPDRKHSGWSMITVDSVRSVTVQEKRLGESAFRTVPQRPDATDFPAISRMELPEGISVDLIFSDDSSVFTACAEENGVLFYGNSRGFLRAVDVNTKRIKWERKFEGSIHSTPVAYAGRVVVGTSDRKIVGLDSLNGKVLWSHSAAAPVISTGVLSKDGSAVFWGDGQGSFLKIRLTDGALLWRADLNAGVFQGKPGMGRELLAVGAWDTFLYLLNTQNGELSWKWNNGKKQILFSPGNTTPIIADKEVVIVAPDRFMTSLDLNSGRVNWRDNSFKFRESLGGSLDGKRFYAKTMDGELVAVAAGRKQFELLWKCDLLFGYEHTPTPILEVKNIALTASRYGVVAAVSADDGKLLWRFQNEAAAVNGFTAAADASVFFSNVNGDIFRISGL